MRIDRIYQPGSAVDRIDPDSKRQQGAFREEFSDRKKDNKSTLSQTDNVKIMDSSSVAVSATDGEPHKLDLIV